MSDMLAKLAAIPILAIFIGAAILAIGIASGWTHQDTQYLIGGLIAVCGAGLAILATVLGLTVGIALYKRLLPPPAPPADPGAPGVRMISGYPVLPYYEPQPPLLTAGSKAGRWSSNGPASYNVWEEPATDQQEEYQ